MPRIRPTIKQHCLKCGKELTRRQVLSKVEYCSRECFYNTRYGELIKSNGLTTRNPKVIEAALLCRSGMTQKESAANVGVHWSTMSGWFTQYGAENMQGERVCAYCGKSFDGLKYRTNRKYCTRGCRTKANNAKKYPIPVRMRYDPKTRAKALELYWGGLECAFIARYLGMHADTVRQWARKFGRLRERHINEERARLLPAQGQLQLAQSPEKWQQILHKYADHGSSSIVILVCGTFDTRGSVGYYATLVYEILKQNPCSDRIYAFCSHSRLQITTICWRRGVFRLTKLPKAYGTYIWPESSIGLQIEVQENELEYLLNLRNTPGRKPYLT